MSSSISSVICNVSQYVHPAIISVLVHFVPNIIQILFVFSPIHSAAISSLDLFRKSLQRPVKMSLTDFQNMQLIEYRLFTEGLELEVLS